MQRAAGNKADYMKVTVDFGSAWSGGKQVKKNKLT